MSQQFTKGHAIIIGVGADLPTTIDDANALADFLKNPAYCAYPSKQVHCLTGTQADRNGILTTLDTLAQQTDDTSTVVFYFSGHGYRAKLPYVGQTYFLMPHGYDVNNLAGTAISGQEFADKMRAIPARKTLIMLDCCRAGGLDIADAKAAGAEFTKAPLPDSVIQQLQAGSGYAFIASSPAGKLSYAGKPYSAFTTALLEALGGRGNARNDGFVYVTDIALHCREMVPQRTRLKKTGPSARCSIMNRRTTFLLLTMPPAPQHPNHCHSLSPKLRMCPACLTAFPRRRSLSRSAVAPLRWVMAIPYWAKERST